MKHLFPCRAHVLALSEARVNGMPEYTWAPVVDDEDNPRVLHCRLDLNFIRPGKDVPPAVEAGKAQDRIGVLFCSVTARALCKPGRRLKMIRGPVEGIFDIRHKPDVALGFSTGHHLEFQVIEVAQSVEVET